VVVEVHNEPSLRYAITAGTRHRPSRAQARTPYVIGPLKGRRDSERRQIGDVGRTRRKVSAASHRAIRSSTRST